MHSIPPGYLLRSISTRIMDAEASETTVPWRGGIFYQRPFDNSDPERDNYKISTDKVSDTEVLHGVDGPRVLSDAVVQLTPLRSLSSGGSHTSALGIGFANINRSIWIGRIIVLEWSVRCEVAT